MSRVTIESLYSDFTVPRTGAREHGVDYEKYAKLAETEIVPRRIVEMIIEKCSIDEMLLSKTTAMEVREIRNYAESLLDQFEKDSEVEEQKIFGQAFNPD